MFITHVKETPDVGHMLDTKGKDKLAVALANAKSELGARPVIEHKVVVFSNTRRRVRIMQSLVVTDNRSESYISFLSIFSQFILSLNCNQLTGAIITCAINQKYTIDRS